MIGEWSVGAALFHLGALEAGHQHLEQALTLYDPAFHGARVWQTGIEPGIFCRCELSRTTTLRGFPDTGLALVQEAVADARALDHPTPLAFALLFEMFAHLARRTPREAQRVYEQLAVVCHAHGIAQELHWAAPLVGRAFIELGDLKRGLRVLEEGLAAHTTTRSALLRPYYLNLLNLLNLYAISEDLHHDLPLPWAGIEFEEHDLLPGPEEQIAGLERHRQRGSHEGRAHVARPVVVAPAEVMAILGVPGCELVEEAVEVGDCPRLELDSS